MLSKIIIENFKAIGKRVEIDLRPITLLFGANSAGKSSILQAFHLAQEIFEGRSIDVHKTQMGGGYVDLGGIAHFIHKRDLTKQITIGFEVDAANAGGFAYMDPSYGTTPRHEMFQNFLLLASIKSFRILLHIICDKDEIELRKTNIYLGYPEAGIIGISFEVNDEEIASIHAGDSPASDAKHIDFGKGIIKFNTNHNIFRRTTPSGNSDFQEFLEFQNTEMRTWFWQSIIAAYDNNFVDKNGWMTGELQGYDFIHRDTKLNIQPIRNKRHKSPYHESLRPDLQNSLLSRICG